MHYDILSQNIHTNNTDGNIHENKRRVTSSGFQFNQIMKKKVK